MPFTVHRAFTLGIKQSATAPVRAGRNILFLRGRRIISHYLVVETHRRLPHYHHDDCWHFVTWHLAGSLPAHRYPPPEVMNSGQAFVWMDRYADTCHNGPHALTNEAVAQVVFDTIRLGHDEKRYRVAAFVIMSNYVHVLICPQGSLSRAMNWLKGASARAANLIIGQTGKRFWQKESYDRVVPTGEEFNRIVRYIEQNPVKAGLVQSPELWRWSSANRALWLNPKVSATSPFHEQS